MKKDISINFKKNRFTVKIKEPLINIGYYLDYMNDGDVIKASKEATGMWEYFTRNEQR